MLKIKFLILFLVIFPGLSVILADDNTTTNNQLKIHSLFQSNMVLQRSKPVDVWGWSKPGDKVAVTFAGKTVAGTAGKDGKWKVMLPAMEANATPGTMTVIGAGAEIKLENILVGDVWVLGGQSNMQWPISRVDNGNIEVASANFPKIRLMKVPQIFGSVLKENFPNATELSEQNGKETTEGSWQICSPETVGGVSAIGYVMGRRIHMTTGIPIGLISTSRGGTTVEAWTPLSKLTKIDTPEVKARLEVTKGKAHHIPGNCFASVISPLSGFAVKGVVFHQGYNNCFNGVQGARMYRAVFPEMIKGWREAFNDPQLPFGILSQCTAGKQQTLENFLPMMTDIGARIREAQYQTFLEFFKSGDKNIGFVSTYDLRRESYHPGLKIPAGERAVVWALGSQYGMEDKFTWLPPVITKVETVDGSLHLTFDKAVRGLSDGAGLNGFAIAGEDMKFQAAGVSYKVLGKKGRKVQYDNKVLVLSCPLVTKPVHYRYAWGRNPMGNIRLSLRFANEVPLPTQRSDNWTNADLLKALTGKDAVEEGKLSKSENNALRSVLEKEDLRRRIEDAKALLKQEKELSSK